MSRACASPGARLLRAALGLSALAGSAPRAAAQQPAPPPAPPDTARRPVLAPVVVTADRARSAPPPVATVRLDTTALRATPAANAYDLVRRVAGLEVHEQGQGPGFTSNAVVRGFNSDHSADVLLVIDGVPVNLPVHGHVEGFADWNLLLPAAVADMRVVHGAASPLYGDFALAGVVEVFTAADAQGAGGALTASSFGDAGGWLRAGRRGARGGSFAAAELRRQQGWQRHSQYWLGNAVVRGWRAAGGGRLEGGVQLYRSAWDSPGFVSVGRYNARDLRDAVDSTDGGEASRLVAHARYARPLGTPLGRPLAVEATAWGQGGRMRMYLNVPGQGAVLRQSGEEDTRAGAGGQAQLVWRLPAGELIAGASGRADRADYALRTTLARQPVALDHAYDARFATGAGFLRYRTVVGTRLGLDLGGRVDALRYDVLDRVADANAASGVPRRAATAVVASPKLGARYLLPARPLGADLSLLASSSRGFRGAVGVIADPRRAPFLAWAHELGVEAERAGGDDGRGALHLHAAAFRMDVTNERVFNPVTLGVGSAGRSRRQGLDVRASAGAGRAPGWLPLGAVTLFGSATLNDARFLGRLPDSTAAGTRPSNPDAFHDHNVPILPGDPVPGVADYTARVGAEGRLGRGEASITAGAAGWRAAYRVLGPFVPIGEPGVRTRAASVLDLGASVPLPGRQRGLVLDLDLQNVLGLRYVENRASGFITPGVPRVLRVALRIP